MKNLSAIVLTSFLLSFNTMAASDSVAVFHRPEKVLILINENGEGERLQTMMNYFERGESMLLENSEKSIKVSCGRKQFSASCTFAFTPGKMVSINERSIKASSTLEELGLTSLDDIEISFESAMSDKFILNVSGDNITFSASKKSLK